MLGNDRHMQDVHVLQLSPSFGQLQEMFDKLDLALLLELSILLDELPFV